MKNRSTGLTILLLLCGCVVLGIVTYVPNSQLKQSFRELFITFETTIKIVVVLIGIGIICAVVIGVIWLGAIAYASGIVWYSLARSKRAEALKLEREASLVITIAPPGSQVYASEVIGKMRLTHKLLYLAPGTVNDTDREPTSEEVRRWSFFQLTQNISRKPEIAVEEVPQLQAPLPEHVDLADYVMEPTSLRKVFLGVGRLPNGQIHPVRAPLSRLVHIAVAGSSGFGKSTFMQSLGYQVLNAQEQPRAVMLDSQGVTFTPFEDDDSLLYPLASDPEDVKAILAELVSEMDKRKALFSRWRAIDSLEKYNGVVGEQDRLPVIPIFFDEFGLMSNDKEIAEYVKKLVQAGRKFGMYLIAGSQTWYSDEIASSLKANLSTSIQFYTQSKSQSRVLLGDSAAYDITRPGQAFCRLPGQAGLIELQAPDAQNMVKITPTLMEVARRPIPTRPLPKQTAQEQAILDLYDKQRQQGRVNKSEIAIEVFGNKGGNQYKKIDEVLEKFGRV